MPGLRAAKKAKTVSRAGAAKAKKGGPNCGSGHGGFKPGNTCGKGKRAALAAKLRDARAEARASGADMSKLRQETRALREHRRGKKDSISNDQAREIHGRLKQHTKIQEARKLVAAADKHKPKPVVDHRDPATHGDHAPGHVGMLNVSLIHADPNRFQYKHGANATGSVGSLAGVTKYDHNLGGIIQVWKDPKDGKTYVVNGHNRVDKAKELGADKVTVRYLDAANAKEARSIGALTNIAEGRGTAIDAAKYFRDTGLTREQIAEKGIPLREKVATDGIALSKLNKPIFDRVVSGELSIERGAIIGAANLNKDEQKALVEMMGTKKGKKDRITNGHLSELVDAVKSARSVRTATKDLFGDHEDDTSLALIKTKMQETIKKKLSKEKRLFSVVSRSSHARELVRGGNQINIEQSGQISKEAAQTLGVFDQLKNRSGPISRSLNDAAERIHRGANPKQVAAETYRAIVRQIPEMLAGGKEFAA